MIRLHVPSTSAVIACIKTLCLYAVAFLYLSDGCSAQDGVDDAQAARDRIVVETLLRLPSVDVNSNPKYLEAVQRHLDRMADDPAQLKIIEQLQLKQMGSRLLDLAAKWGPTTEGVKAIDLAMERGEGDELWRRLTVNDDARAPERLAEVVALSNRRDILDLLSKLLLTREVSSPVKSAAATGLARSIAGQRRLLEITDQGQLPPEVRLIVGSLLRSSEDESIRKAAFEKFPPIRSKQAPLPPLAELVKLKGDIAAGKAIFYGAANCAQCHIVQGVGKNVGPDLSEIGDKLSREAMFVAILDPSAGISHNYETYILVLDDDSIITGLLTSQTDDQVVIKDAQGILRTFDRAAVTTLKKSTKSLMPEGLQETMNQTSLVDLIEFLASLRKTKKEDK